MIFPDTRLIFHGLDFCACPRSQSVINLTIVIWWAFHPYLGSIRIHAFKELSLYHSDGWFFANFLIPLSAARLTGQVIWRSAAWIFQVIYPSYFCMFTAADFLHGYSNLLIIRWVQVSCTYSSPTGLYILLGNWSY